LEDSNVVWKDHWLIVSFDGVEQDRLLFTNPDAIEILNPNAHKLRLSGYYYLSNGGMIEIYRLLAN